MQYGGFSPVRLQGRFIRRGLPPRHIKPWRAVCVRPSCSSLSSSFSSYCAEETLRFCAPPFKRPSSLCPRGPRSNLALLSRSSTLNCPHPPHSPSRHSFPACQVICGVSAVQQLPGVVRGRVVRGVLT